MARKRTAAKEPAMNATKLHNDVNQGNSPDEKATLPHNERHFLIGKLANVHAGQRVTFIQSPGEEMRQFVKLAKFPLRKGGVTTPPYRRRILVILLDHKQKAW